MLGALLALTTPLGAVERVPAVDESVEQAPAVPPLITVSAVTADSVTIYGDVFFGELDAASPLLLLFHQGGANGRGEYTEIASWLNDAGYRAIAWDQRSGGDMFGESNRTVAGLSDETPSGYCDAYQDLEAALTFVISEGMAEQVIAWGSSYSAALVFRLAAENPDRVSGVVAFSPASGGPLVNCRARMWVNDVKVPMLVFRPDAEMARETSVEQRDILTTAGVSFRVVENGVHGSSLLVDGRTEHDMSRDRTALLEWLGEVTLQ